MKLKFENEKLEQQIFSIIEVRAHLIHIFDLLEQYGEDTHIIPEIKMEERGLFKIALKGRVKLRLYFCYHENSTVFCTALSRKVQKPQKKELEKARKALQEVKK